MNIVAATFHGVRIRVTYKCGHVAIELSASDAETRERKRIASNFDCTCCSVDRRLNACKQPTKIEADPTSLLLAARRKEVMTRLEQRFGQLRTH